MSRVPTARTRRRPAGVGRWAVAFVASALLLAGCAAEAESDAPGGEPLDVLSTPQGAPETASRDGERAAPVAESPREDVASALDNPIGEGLPEPLIDISRIMSGGPPPDGIPPVDDPRFDTVAEVDWLDPDEPVLALRVGGQDRAYPVQIMMWHEIVNDEIDGVPVSVTYCPLCNSALVFDRRLTGPDGVERVVSFGTSGSLYHSDLLMYDRQTESLWSQLIGLAVAGTLTGVDLDRYPVQTVSFGDWSQQHPDGLVLNRITGQERNYGANPYERYDEETNAPFLFDGEVDERLPPKRRVVGVATPDGSSALAVDHALLERDAVVPVTLDDRDLVAVMASSSASALDDGDIAQGRPVGSTAVLDPALDGERLTLQVDGSRLTDAETGSTWSLAGVATDGPLAGEVLDVLPHTDPFWFAWAAFYPDTDLVAE